VQRRAAVFVEIWVSFLVLLEPSSDDQQTLSFDLISERVNCSFVNNCTFFVHLWEIDYDDFIAHESEFFNTQFGKVGAVAIEVTGAVHMCSAMVWQIDHVGIEWLRIRVNRIFVDFRGWFARESAIFWIDNVR